MTSSDLIFDMTLAGQKRVPCLTEEMKADCAALRKVYAPEPEPEPEPEVEDAVQVLILC